MSPGQYHHFASWVSHNPFYEYILFDDNDVDDFVCENFPENVSSAFSKIVAGASKIDFWRVMVMMLYGGVYMDADLMALRPLPILPQNDIVSGKGCWSTSPEQLPPGVLEHWSMAISAHHSLPRETFRFIMHHLTDPKRTDKDVIRTTGPGPYQFALHSLLKKAKCPGLCSAHFPAQCDQELFRTYIGNLSLFPGLNFNDTYSNKLFDTSEYKEGTFFFKHYDDYTQLDVPIENFCSEKKRKERRRGREEIWNKSLAKRVRVHVMREKEEAEARKKEAEEARKAAKEEAAKKKEEEEARRKAAEEEEAKKISAAAAATAKKKPKETTNAKAKGGEEEKEAKNETNA